MQVSRLLLAAALTSAAFVAQAETPDLSGQFAQRVNSPATKTRAEVRAEYIASREAVAAMTREDSGSAYLAAQRRTTDGSRRLAGSPVNAQ